LPPFVCFDERLVKNAALYAKKSTPIVSDTQSINMLTIGETFSFGLLDWSETK
jgi:hypothetical protein